MRRTRDWLRSWCVLAGALALLQTGSHVIVTAQTPKGPDAKVVAAALVNLNTATAEQLDRLPGVGPKTAALIIEYRVKNGGFKRVEDLMNVRGIGEKTFIKLRPLVTLTPLKSDRPGGVQ